MRWSVPCPGSKLVNVVAITRGRCVQQPFGSEEERLSIRVSVGEYIETHVNASRVRPDNQCCSLCGSDCEIIQYGVPSLDVSRFGARA